MDNISTYVVPAHLNAKVVELINLTIHYVVDSVFDKPKDFVPERWYSQPELIKKREAFHPFGAGEFLLFFFLETK